MKLKESHLERVHIHDLIKPMTAGILVMVSLRLPNHNAKERIWILLKFWEVLKNLTKRRPDLTTPEGLSYRFVCCFRIFLNQTYAANL